MTEGRITTADLLSRTATLIARHPTRNAIVFIALAGAGFAIDSGFLSHNISDALNLVLACTFAGAQHYVVRTALEDSGLQRGARPRFAAYLGLSLLANAAILLGLLLVLPGILLLVRWWAAVPVLLDSEATISGALSESWSRTRPHLWAILGLAAAIWLPAVAGVAATIALTVTGAGLLSAILIINLLLCGALLASWNSSVAVYRSLSPTQPSFTTA